MTWLAPGAVNLIGRLPTRHGVAPYPRGEVGRIGTLVAHYLGDPDPNGSVAGYGDLTPAQIASFHVNPGAQELFPAIAYTWVVTADGTLHQCHALETISWQVAGKNSVTRGVVLTGFGRRGQPNETQLRTLAALWAALAAHLGRWIALSGHRLVVANSACPGDLVHQWLARTQQIKAAMEEAMDELELRAVMGEMRRAWSVQGGARAVITALMADGSEGAKAVALAAGSWRKALNWIEAKLGETETS